MRRVAALKLFSAAQSYTYPCVGLYSREQQNQKFGSGDAGSLNWQGVMWCLQFFSYSVVRKYESLWGGTGNYYSTRFLCFICWSVTKNPPLNSLQTRNATNFCKPVGTSVLQLSQGFVLVFLVCCACSVEGDRAQKEKIKEAREKQIYLRLWIEKFDLETEN